MNLAELKKEAAWRVGQVDPAASPTFLLEADRLVNQANIEVGKELQAPQRLSVLDAHVGISLPFPADIGEDGIISVTADYKNLPTPLRVITIEELNQEWPMWQSASPGSSMYLIHDPRNPTYDLRLIPNPVGPVDYSVHYRLKPLPMVSEDDLPLAAIGLNGAVSCLAESGHILVALKAALLFLKGTVYQRDRTANTIDANASKVKMIEGDYARYMTQTNTAVTVDTIKVSNPMYAPRRGGR